MTDGPEVTRQWVSIPGGSVDARIGAGVTSHISNLMRGVSGRNPRCLVFYDPDLDAGLLEELRREVVGAGYGVTTRAMVGKAATVEAAQELMSALAEAHVTKDDAVFAAGDINLLSVASLACDVWCGGVPLVLYPMDLDAFVEAPATPHALDCAGRSQMVSGRPSARRMYCDLDVVSRDPGAEATRFARALMVSTAMASSEKEFSRLWDNAEDLMVGDETTLVLELGYCAKGRGRLMSSTSIALRQSASYGFTFLRAMRPLVSADVPDSTLFAEGLRFCARVSAGTGKFAVDDVFAQDDLLDIMGLGQTPMCAVDPEAMRQALKGECFLRTNRFMLELPQVIGRVRLTAVDDDLLREHTDAWCSSHAPEAV